MRVRKLFVFSCIAFLLTLSMIVPVGAQDWGDPLATDPPGDGVDYGDDILSVDARYANEFVYFRFQMNEPIMEWM